VNRAGSAGERRSTQRFSERGPTSRALRARSAFEICPGVIYENVPTTAGRVDQVEAILNEQGLQVVWETESMDALKSRKRPNG